jgi:hypothetical protein
MSTTWLRTLAAASLAVGGVACGNGDADTAPPTEVETVRDLNEEFEALNERTVPDIDDDPFPEPALLEENFVEGARLLREKAEAAPAEIASDLTAYTEWNQRLSDLYAEFGYDRQAVWAAEPYTEEHQLPEEARTGIQEWFLEHCGVDLQG